MRDREPLVSVILPVYNNAAFLEASLESLSKQSYKKFEIVAIDDFSKDSSWQILRLFKKRKKKLSIRMFRNKKHYDLAVTLNRAIRRARGPFVAFASPNDLCAKKRIERQVAFLLKNPKVAAVGTQCAFMDKRSRPIGKSSFPTIHEDMLATIFPSLSVQPETVMVNKLLLPNDALRFKKRRYPFIYTEVFVQCARYGRFANLTRFLHTHRKTSFTTPKLLSVLPSLVKAQLRSFAMYDYRPSIRSLFLPLLRTRPGSA